MNATDEAIKRGSELLDIRRPGWRDEIDASGLHLADCATCVLGQLYGGYSEGLNALGIPEDVAWYYGFALPDDGVWHPWSIRSQWGALTRKWRKVLS